MLTKSFCIETDDRTEYKTTAEATDEGNGWRPESSGDEAKLWEVGVELRVIDTVLQPAHVDRLRLVGELCTENRTLFTI